MLYLVNGWPYGNSFQKPFPLRSAILFRISMASSVSLSPTWGIHLPYWMPEFLAEVKTGEKKGRVKIK